MTSAPLCFLDTETDGVHPDRKVWEVAMIRRDDSRQRERSFFVEIDLSTADPFGLRVGRFYDRHPFGAFLANLGKVRRPEPSYGEWSDCYLDRATAAEQVARMTHGAHIVGAVPSFDAEVLAALLRWHDLTPAWHHHLIDVESLAVGWLHGSGPVNGDPVRAGVTVPWKSDDLSRLCGVEPPTEDERHTALGDARWVMRLYDAITAQPPDGP